MHAQEKDKFIEEVQGMLDKGMTMTKAAKELGVHHSKITRLMDRGIIEIYKAFDEEEDKQHLYQNFEWLWEEDWLERMLYKAFDGECINLARSEDQDVYAVGVYVRDNYGSLPKFLRKKGWSVLISNFNVKCQKCQQYAPLENWYPDKRKAWGLMRECPDCRIDICADYAERNPEKIFESHQKRREMAEVLPGDYIKEDWVKVREAFNWKCALTNKIASVTMDHFIPVTTGHGGTFEGNMIPITKSLNSSKNARNPFSWNCIEGYDKELFNKAVKYMARLNHLSVEEYKNFVHWCFDNPRNANEVRADQRNSIEIWREATGQHFPLPKHALSELGNRSTNETDGGNRQEKQEDAAI